MFHAMSSVEKQGHICGVTVLYELAYQWGIKEQDRIYTVFLLNALL